MNAAVSSELVKFAQNLRKCAPPSDFAQEARGSPELVENADTHFGKIAMLAENGALDGFWLIGRDGELYAAPDAAIAELLENQKFVPLLLAAYDARKKALFDRMVRTLLQPGDMVLYQTDPERKRTFLFHIGDGREIVVFSNEKKSEILRAALIKSGPFGTKSINKLTADLYEPLYEHESIESVLCQMASENPADGMDYAKEAPSELPPQQAQAAMPRMLPTPPAAKYQKPASKSQIPPAPKKQDAQEGQDGEKYLDDLHEVNLDSKFYLEPAMAAGKMGVEGNARKGAVEAKKGAKGGRNDLKKAQKKAQPAPVSHEGKSSQPAGAAPAAPPPGFDPYAAQKKILHTLESLHRERLESDIEREKSITGLNKRLNSLERTIKQFSKEIGEYGEGFKRRHETIESNLRGWARYSSQLTQFGGRIEELTDTCAEIAEKIEAVGLPAEKDEEWAAKLADTLATLKHVSSALADEERKHKEQLEKMSVQLQKSLDRAVLRTTKKAKQK